MMPAELDAHVISFSPDLTDNPEVSISGRILLPARNEEGRGQHGRMVEWSDLTGLVASE
jgi:hypothetical protein